MVIHLLFFTIAFALAPLALADAPAKKLNILVLYADDWRFDTLGSAGNSIVKTPNLDQLAKEGIRFTHNYVTTAICGVSRASLLTGQWMSRHGNTAFEMFKTPWSETYPSLLRHHGYFVGYVGKWHNGAFPQANFDFAREYSGTHWIHKPNGAKIHVTQKNQDDAIEFLLTRPADQPFCLTVAFFAPHAEDQNSLQYLPQPWSLPVYQDTVIPVPSTSSDEYFNRLPSFIANEQNEGRVRYRWRFDTPDKYQAMMRNYYRLCTEVDSACGRLLEVLREQGVLENTLVIFTSDNGYFHGEHGLADKWYPYEESIRTPLLVYDPRLPVSKRGQAIGDITLNVDLAPTILAASKIPIPPRMQGHDFASLYLAPSAPSWRTEFFYEHPTIRNISFIPSSQALVRKDVKYIYWPDFKQEELFDLQTDQSETKNLANDVNQPPALGALRNRLGDLRDAAR
jgi:arylsulfatase A-like enzyme